MDDKGIQIGSPKHELRRLLRENGFLEPEKIERVDHMNLAGHKTRWLHFRRDRKNGSGTKSTNMGYGFRITFTARVRGPIALGYGAHFGLGLFELPNGKRE
jgi:CRISPR-associated protein Csb2